MASDPWIQLGGVTGAFGLAGFVLRQVRPIITLYREALEDASTERGSLHAEVADAKRVASAASDKADAAVHRADLCEQREVDQLAEIRSLRAEVADLRAG